MSKLPKSLILLIFTSVILFSPQLSLAQPSDDGWKDQLNSALASVFGNEQFSLTTIDLSDADGGEKLLQTSIQLFGANDVSLNATSSSDKRVQSLEVEFPDDAFIDFNRINALTDNKLKQYLPSAFPLEAGVAVQSLEVVFGSTGYLPEELTGVLGTSKDWEIIGTEFLSMQSVLLSFNVQKAAGSSTTITGTVGGQIDIGGLLVDASASISNDPENIVLEVSLGNLSLESMTRSIVYSDPASFLNLIPQVFKEIDVTGAKIALYPGQKRINFSAQSSFGGILMDCSKSTGNTNILLAVQPPSQFNFSRVSDLLAPLDQIDLSGSYFIVSDHQDEVESSTLSGDPSDETVYSVNKGLNLVTSMKLPPEIAEMLKVTDITLSGSIPLNFSGISLFAALGLDLSIGSNEEFTFKSIGAGLSFNVAGTAELRLEGVGTFKTGSSPVDIFGGITAAASPTGMSLKLDAGLAAGGYKAEKPASCKVEQPEWFEPFGVPGVGIRSLGIGAGIGTTFPFINILEIDGNIRFGTVTDKQKHLCASLTTSVNIADLGKTMIVAELNGLTPLQMIEAFSEDANITGPLRDALNTGIQSAKLKIVPKDMTLFGKQYSAGIALDSARLSIAGISGMLGFSFGTSGIKAYGSLDRFAIEEGGITFFALEAARPDANGIVGGPSVSLGLDANDPHFRLDGKVTVLGMESSTFVKIDKTGLDCEITGNLMGGALSATAHITAGEFTDTSGLYAKVEFKQDIQEKVATALKDFIKTESEKNQQAYRDAKNVLDNTKGANDVEQSFIDLAGETVTAFEEMDRGLAVAATYVVEGLLEDAFNLKEISFEGSITSMKANVKVKVDMVIAGQTIDEEVSMELDISEDMFTDMIVEAIGSDVIDFFGSLDNEIANEFEKIGDDLETAFEDLGGYLEEGATIVGEGIIEGGEIVGDELVKAADYMATALNDFGKEMEKVFVGDSYSPPVSNGNKSVVTPYDHTKVRVTVKSIKVTDNEGWGDALELYGSIIVSIPTIMKGVPGATPYAYGRSMVNSISKEQDESITVNHSKDFYILNSYLDQGNGSIGITSKMLEWNSNIDYDYLVGSTIIKLKDLQLGITTHGSFTGFEDRGDDEEITIYYSVQLVERKGSAPPPPDVVQMRAAVHSGNISEMSSLEAKGGNLKIDNIIEEVIQQKGSYQVVERLLKAGNMAKSNQVTLATNPNFRNPDIVRVLFAAGVRANGDALLNEVGTNNVANAKWIVQHKAVPQLRHVQKALALNNVPMMEYLLSVSNVQVGTQELAYAVNQNNLSLAKAFVDHGATSTPVLITSAIQKGNTEMVDLLLFVGSADHTALQAAANRNDTGLFKTLLKHQVRLVGNGPVNTAINQNNFEILKAGITHGGSKDLALSYAAEKQNKQAMLVILNAGGHGTFALEYATTKNDIEFFEQLLTLYSADPNTGLKQAYTQDRIEMGKIALNTSANASLQIAQSSAEGKEEWVKLLLSHNADANLGLDGAVKSNHTAVVDLLLDAGAKVDQPIMIVNAVNHKNLPMVKSLVEKGGANPDRGRTYAISNNDVPMARYLLEKGAQPIGLKLPAENGWLEMIKALVDNGGDPNEGIDVAVGGDHTAIALYLLDNGAATGKLLQVTAEKGNELITKKLIEKGADPIDGTFNAVRYKRISIMNILIDAGADVSRAALMDGAVYHFHKEMIVLLLANNGDKVFVTQQKEGYLHRVAGEKGRNDLVQIFVDAGLDVNAKNSKGESPLHLAVRKGKKNSESIQVLIDAGADVNAETDKGKSVLKRAVSGPVKTLLKEAGAI